MKTPTEVIKWLKDNAYAVKGKDYWLLSDFPLNELPDKLEIPMNRKRWDLIINP